MKRIFLLVTLATLAAITATVAICYSADMTIVQDIRIRFEIDTPQGRYSDSLYFPTGTVVSAKMVAPLAQARVDNWLYQLAHPPPIVEPTKADLEAQAVAMDEQMRQLVTAKEALVKAIAAKEAVK